MRIFNICVAIFGAFLGVAAIGYSTIVATTEVAWVMALIGVGAVVVGWMAHRRACVVAAFVASLTLWAIQPVMAQNVQNFNRGMVQFTNVLVNWSNQSPALRDATVQTGNAQLDQFIQAGRAFNGKVLPIAQTIWEKEVGKFVFVPLRRVPQEQRKPTRGYFAEIRDASTGSVTYRVGVSIEGKGVHLILASVCQADFPQNFNLQTDGAGRTTGTAQMQATNVRCGGGYAAAHDDAGTPRFTFVNNGGQAGNFATYQGRNDNAATAIYSLGSAGSFWSQRVPGQLPKQVPACLSQGSCR